MTKRIHNPTPPSAFAKEIQRRFRVPAYVAQVYADLHKGAVYGD